MSKAPSSNSTHVALVVSLFFEPILATTSTTTQSLSKTGSSAPILLSTKMATTTLFPTLSVKTNSIAMSATEGTTTFITITTSAAETMLNAKTTESSTVKIWAPIVAVASTVIVGLLVFFTVRHFGIRGCAKRENNSDYEVPYVENPYEQPYRNSDENGTQNHTENLENEEIYEVYQSDRDSIKYETYEEAEYEEYNNKN